jgi:hypothetical protein
MSRPGPVARNAAALDDMRSSWPIAASWRSRACGRPGARRPARRSAASRSSRRRRTNCAPKFITGAGDPEPRGVARLTRRGIRRSARAQGAAGALSGRRNDLLAGEHAGRQCQEQRPEPDRADYPAVGPAARSAGGRAPGRPAPAPEICPRSTRRTVERLTPVACAICCCVAFGFARRASIISARRFAGSLQYPLAARPAVNSMPARSAIRHTVAKLTSPSSRATSDAWGVISRAAIISSFLSGVILTPRRMI